MKTKAIILGLILTSVISFANTGNDFSEFSNSTNSSVNTEEISIEDGISNLNNFEFVLSSYYEMEEDIGIEKWMIDVENENWDSNLQEKELQVENWMNNPSSWVNKK